VTETDLMPNPVAVDSERDEGKSKKLDGLWEPKSELPPNRIYEIAIGGSSMSELVIPLRVPKMPSRLPSRSAFPHDGLDRAQQGSKSGI